MKRHIGKVSVQVCLNAGPVIAKMLNGPNTCQAVIPAGCLYGSSGTAAAFAVSVGPGVAVQADPC